MNFLVAVLVVVAVSAGCVSTSGTPTAESDGTTVTVTVAPSTTVQDTTSATPTGVTPTTTQAPVAQELPPNERGYVTVRTATGLTKCLVSADAVICESGSNTGWPLDPSGERYVSFRVTSDGAVTWAQGNLGAAQGISMSYATYRAVGWTIVADVAGTTFTNDATGHGAFVSLQEVRTF
jgi:hypothetical protein